MITVQKTISLPIQEWRTYKAILSQAAKATLAAVPAQPDGDITVVLSNDNQIRALNHQFRGLDSPTDVLSFNLDEFNPRSGRKYLGDVIISLERAREQAASAAHSLEAELALLTVHGVLHLCGYDHEQPVEQEQMWALQKAILSSLGIHLSLPNQ
ncbi:MAG: rRNA maturation RNase YbeY [Anaerolineae bacterium]|jgi:probable rRNA maturation factor|nr:MAG: rRNA maturation RNase YbeY [Anaerolineae bacterium]